MTEFDLIARLQRTINAGRHGLTRAGCIGIGDDAAVLGIPDTHQLLVTTDTLVSGVHFPIKTNANDIGYKALAVNLSDLAAMGADPAWFFLALTLPGQELEWLDGFADGLAGLAKTSGIELAGGDTTSGPLSITITALGLCPRGSAVLRSGAKAGDLVVISGTPGLAALGLRQWQHGKGVDSTALAALTRPEPRLQLGRVLRDRASACIDISDGLAADLAHLAMASGVGARVCVEHLPRATAMQDLSSIDCWNLQLGGGDDYELCFTLAPELEHEVAAMAEKGGVPLTVIGCTTEGPEISFVKNDGEMFQPARIGFNHFPGNSEIWVSPE